MAAPMGQFAPAVIQRLKVSTSDCESRVPGGIFNAPDCKTAEISRLASGFPGVIAAPRLPPFNAASLAVSESPDIPEAAP